MPGVLFLAALFAGLWLFSDHLPFQNEITVYQMFCTGERKDGRCSLKEEVANPIKYKALVDAQIVIYWFDGDRPSKLQDCAVRNSRNWSCRVGDIGMTEYHMVDGDFTRISESPNIFYPAPKWHWWRVWLEEKLR